MNPRTCFCGQEIQPTAKTIEYGRKHGRDPSTWPVHCNACIVDRAIEMFLRVDDAPPVPACAKCKNVLGPKHYSDVPKIGNLCLKCHAKRMP